MWITIVVAIALLVLDQVTKILIDNSTKTNIFEIPHFVKIVKSYNTGAAWGMLDNNTWVLVIVSLIASGILGYLCYKNDWKRAKLRSISLTMAFAGCVGNLIDRFLTVCKVREGVVDMISFTPFDWIMGLIRVSPSIFNVADVFLVIGLILFSIDYIFFYDKRVMKNGVDDK